MTTLAWDGTTLAADSQTTLNSKVTSLSARKLCRLDDGRLVGMSGSCHCQTGFEDWLNGKRDKPPKGDYSAVVIALDGSARCYEDCEDYWEVGAPFARGSGESIALAAMHCGKTAEEAVELATRLDIYSGGPVTTLQLEVQP